MRNKYHITLLIPFLIITQSSCLKNNNGFMDKLTSINPVSYTDVVYMGRTDTVVVSTFSGRIAQIINGQPLEKVKCQLDDEIYSMAYSYRDRILFAATLESGILAIDIDKGKIINELSIKDLWCTSLVLSPDESILGTYDLGGNNYLWDINNNFTRIEVPDIPKNMLVRYIDRDHQVYFSGNNSIIVWSLDKGCQTNEWKSPGKLIDVADNGALLLINSNEFIEFDVSKNEAIITQTHPDWPLTISSGETVRIPYHMALTKALFSEEKIYSCGIDRTIRIWDRKSGELISEWIKHNATISGIKIARSSDQVVTVDLKGGIFFWDL